MTVLAYQSPGHTRAKSAPVCGLAFGDDPMKVAPGVQGGGEQGGSLHSTIQQHAYAGDYAEQLRQSQLCRSLQEENILSLINMVRSGRRQAKLNAARALGKGSVCHLSSEVCMHTR